MSRDYLRIQKKKRVFVIFVAVSRQVPGKHLMALLVKDWCSNNVPNISTPL